MRKTEEEYLVYCKKYKQKYDRYIGMYDRKVIIYLLFIFKWTIRSKEMDGYWLSLKP